MCVCVCVCVCVHMLKSSENINFAQCNKLIVTSPQQWVLLNIKYFVPPALKISNIPHTLDLLSSKPSELTTTKATLYIPFTTFG